MINKELVDWINKNLQQGYELSLLKEQLIKNGWAIDDITDSIEHVKQIENIRNSHNFKNYLTKSGVKYGLILFIILFFGISIFLVLIHSSSISNKILLKGTNFNLSKGQIKSFILNNETHKITLNEINKNKVTLMVQSNPIEVNLTLDEEKEINIENSTNTILDIKLLGISKGIANIFIKQIILKNKTVNLSGIKSNISKIENKTVIISKIKNGNSISPNSTVPIKKNLTLNDVFGKPLFILTCNKIDSFVKNSKSCSYFNTTCNVKMDLFGSGEIQNIKTYLEIKGFKNGKCVLYSFVENASVSLSASLINKLIGLNHSRQDINQKLIKLNKKQLNLIGKNSTCHYPLNKLYEKILGYQSGNISFSSQDSLKYNCTGSMYQNTAFTKT